MDKIEFAGSDHLETLRRCGGYYVCPKDVDGRRLGPLVGYAGKYEEASNGEKRQYVGDIYANFAKAEEHPGVLYYFAGFIGLRSILNSIDVFCGAPIGGYNFSLMLGLIHDLPVIKAEKKVIALANENMREQSRIAFGRHDIESGARYAIVEDVCNNFSTTEELIALIKSLGGEVTAIVCLLNRSLAVDGRYSSKASGQDLPVISLVRLPIPEYRQDHPFVVHDVTHGNVVLKPKDEWSNLMQTMSINANHANF